MTERGASRSGGGDRRRNTGRGTRSGAPKRSSSGRGGGTGDRGRGTSGSGAPKRSSSGRGGGAGDRGRGTSGSGVSGRRPTRASRGDGRGEGSRSESPSSAGGARGARSEHGSSRSSGERSRARRTSSGAQSTRGSGTRSTGSGARRGRSRARGGGGHWVDEPSPKYRAPAGESAPEAAPRSKLRTVGSAGTSTRPGASKRGRGAPKRARRTARRPRRETEASEELRALAGNRAPEALAALESAADAFEAGREREAAGLLRPLRDAYPDAACVRELLGLAQYRQGHYRAAATELEAFVERTGSVEQHPVLMDCYRAQRRYEDVGVLWNELRAASPSAALVAEGRIVAAGALADDGELDAAIRLLTRKSDDVRNPRDHHLRLWYVLADLRERAGAIPEARSLFERIARADPGFADVAERLASL